MEEFLKSWEGVKPQYGKADCHFFVRDYLNKFFPGHKLKQVEYKSLYGACRQALLNNWINELSKVFKIEFDVLEEGTFILEQSKDTIPSIYIHSGGYAYSVFPGIGFYRIKLEDVQGISLKYINIRGIK